MQFLSCSAGLPRNRMN